MIVGQGMPSMRHHDFGNMYIQFDVKFPQKEDLSNLHLLEQVLPPRIQQTLVPQDSMSEDFVLEDVDPRNQARAHGAAGLDDEDEDGIPAGAERMQCASQ
jgi:DnaJ family protein A protein 2